jgi:hypothetical protein
MTSIAEKDWGKAGAPEIEITSEMIEAGLDRFLAHDPEPSLDKLRHALISVRSMSPVALCGERD